MSYQGYPLPATYAAHLNYLVLSPTWQPYGANLAFPVLLGRLRGYFIVENANANPNPPEPEPEPGAAAQRTEKKGRRH
jgi:hypothetical protein